MPSIESPLERAHKALSATNMSLEEKRLAISTFSASLGDHVDLDQSQHILSLLPLSELYGVLNSCSEYEETDPHHSQLMSALCDLIRKILGPFPYSALSQGDNKIYLEQGLQHFSPPIRYLSLQQVEKALANPAETVEMVNSQILPMVVTTIAFQDTRTANKVIDILQKACISDVACAQFFQSQAIQLLQSMLQINGTVGYRVYDLIMKIAGTSDQAFALCESSGILAQLIEELNTDDLLLRMNAIELLNEFAATAAGLQFLIKAHLMEKLTDSLDIDNDQDVAVALTKCAVLKFFGSLGHNNDVDFSIIQQQYHVLERLEKCLDSDNKEIQTVALASVGLAGSHLNGLRLLQSAHTLLDKFYEISRTASGDTRTIVLQSLSKLIGVSNSEGPSDEIEQRTLSVYQSLPGYENAVKNFMAVVKQPMENVRIAAFALLESIASHQWGRQEISQCFEFLGYLLDRSNEYTESGQMWKYAIVKKLVENGSEAESTFGRHYPMLTQYVRQGPYYRPTQVTTAMESG